MDKGLTTNEVYNNYVTLRGLVLLIGSVQTNAFSCEKLYIDVFFTSDTYKYRGVGEGVTGRAAAPP